MNGLSFTSTIDHFFWDEQLGEMIHDSGVIHHPSNLSDHSPIYCKINTAAIEKDPVSQNTKTAPRPSWRKYTKDEKDKFGEHLHSLLSEINVKDELTLCEDVHCKN